MDPQTQQFLQAEAQRAAEELGVKTDDAPQTPAPESTPEPVNEPVVTPAPEASPSEEAPQTEPETVEQPTTVATVEDEDEDLYPTFPQYQQPTPEPEAQPQPVAPVPQQQVPQPQQPSQLPTLDVSQFTDQYGNVDMARFTAAMRTRDETLINQVTSNLTQRFNGDFGQLAQVAIAQARQEATNQYVAAEAEKRGWDRTFAKYPQVKDNKDLRDQIHKMRLGEVAVTGKPVSPVKMADRYFAQIAQAREDGVRQAVETTKVQATAHLETANNTASEKGLKAQQDWSKIDNRDRRVSTNARTDILKQMLADGKI